MEGWEGGVTVNHETEKLPWWFSFGVKLFTHLF